VSRQIRDFLRQTRGRYCFDCLGAKLSLPAVEVRLAVAELQNEVARADGRFDILEAVCWPCGRCTQTVTFRATPLPPRTSRPPCVWCGEAIGTSEGVATVNNDSRVVKVHMHCLRAYRASRFDVN